MIHRPMNSLLLLLASVLLISPSTSGYPKPSPYPITWQLNFDYNMPRRVVVTTPGTQVSQAYWYITYTIANLSSDDQKFLPIFQLMTEDGQVIRSDDRIPNTVLDTIRVRERNSRLQPIHQIAGTLRIGEDQGKEGVAIWREPNPRMGRFSIFVGGLSGESVILKDDKGNVVMKKDKDGKQQPVVLHKTLQLAYHMAGDEKLPGNDVVDFTGESWVMR